MAQRIVVPGQQVIGVSRPPVVGVSWERPVPAREFEGFQGLDGQAVTPLRAERATLLGPDGKPVPHADGLEYFLSGAGHVVTRQAPFAACHPTLARLARAAGIAGMTLGSLGLVQPVGAGGISSETFSSVIPLGAANADGAYGSHWTDRQLLQNPTDFELSGELCLTERGQSESTDDPCVPYTIAPHETLVIDGLYALAKPGAQGAARVRLIPDVNQQRPVWRAQIFNQSPDGEFGMSLRPDSTLYTAGNTLEDVLSDTGYRDGLFVSTGADGATIHWTLVDAATGAVTEVDAQYGPNTTVQYTSGVGQLFGVTPAPGSYLTARIDDGQAMTYLSRNNNTTSDGAWDPFTRKIIAKIIGLDYDGDGIADNIDADGDHVLDNVVGVYCNDPYGAYHFNIIAESPRSSPSYSGSGMPAGMSVDPGTGVITYDPPCSDAGQLFSPTFYISGAEFHMSIPFRVN